MMQISERVAPFRIRRQPCDVFTLMVMSQSQKKLVCGKSDIHDLYGIFKMLFKGINFYRITHLNKTF